MPLGKSRSVGDDGGRVIGIDPDDDAALAGLRSDVGATGVVDDHVTEVGGSQFGQIGDRGDVIAVVGQQLAGFGRHDQQGAVGPEAQPRRRVPGQRQGGERSAQSDGVHGLAEHVGEPEHSLEPAGPLTEAESVGQWNQRRSFTKHAISVTLARCHCQLAAVCDRPCHDDEEVLRPHPSIPARDDRRSDRVAPTASPRSSATSTSP